MCALASIIDNVDRRVLMQALYVELIAADGITAVHRLLSEAVIAGRHTAKAPPAAKAPKPAPDAATIGRSGQQITLGPAMAALSAKRRLFVLHMVRGGLAAKEAAVVAGLFGKHAHKTRSVPVVRDAIAEVRGER